MNVSSPGTPQDASGVRAAGREPASSEPREGATALAARALDFDGSGAVHVIVQTDEVRVLLSGEIDASLAGEFRSALDVVTAEALPVTLDAHHVSFMDSFGVAFVSQVALAAPGGRARMMHVPPTVRFLLDVTQTSDLVDLDEPEG